MESVRALVEACRYKEAAKISEQSCIASEDLWLFLDDLLSTRRFDHASNFLEESLPLLNPNQLTTRLVNFSAKLLTEKQVALAIKWSFLLVRLNPENRPNPFDCIQFAIDQDLTELALKSIFDLPPGISHPFPLPVLIQKLMDSENFSMAWKWAQKFKLTNEFPPKQVFSHMIRCRQWENAENFKSVVNFSWMEFMEWIVLAKDWSAAKSYLKRVVVDLNALKNPEEEKLVTSMVKGMLADNRFMMAMHLVFASSFLRRGEFPPARIVRHMILSGEFGLALRMIRVLHLDWEGCKESEGISLAMLEQRKVEQLLSFRKLVQLRRKQQQKNIEGAGIEVVVVVEEEEVLFKPRTKRNPMKEPSVLTPPPTLLSSSHQTTPNNNVPPQMPGGVFQPPPRTLPGGVFQPPPPRTLPGGVFQPPPRMLPRGGFPPRQMPVEFLPLPPSRMPGGYPPMPMMFPPPMSRGFQPNPPQMMTSGSSPVYRFPPLQPQQQEQQPVFLNPSSNPIAPQMVQPVRLKKKGFALLPSQLI